MILKLYVNSEIGAHVWNDCLVGLILDLQKRPISLHTNAACPELPYYMNTMSKATDYVVYFANM